MFEKVSMSHPDKVADRIAGALVDLAYKKNVNPKIAVEVLLGHNHCMIIAETSVHNTKKEVKDIVDRIVGSSVDHIEYIEVPQDQHLADNQSKEIRCGDNGIFKGVPMTDEQTELSLLARHIYATHPYDGKYIIDKDNYVICQSNVKDGELDDMLSGKNVVINPLGYWTGGIDVDSGATNRKLGSDMADSITGGGLHGKDLSKADVSINIYCWLEAQRTGHSVTACCAIGDSDVTIRYCDYEIPYAIVPYKSVVEVARNYIESVGGFEKFAEWGLV